MTDPRRRIDRKFQNYEDRAAADHMSGVVIMIMVATVIFVFLFGH